MLNAFLNRVPLRLMLVVPFVLQIILTVGLTGYLTWRNSQQAVNEVAARLRSEVIARVENHLADFMAVPHRLNLFGTGALTTGELNLDDAASRERYFYNLLNTFPTINNAFVGLETGEFYGARKLVDAQGQTEVQLTRNDLSTQQQLYYYRANARGEHTDLIQKVPDYDARQRPWYQAAKTQGQATWSEVYLDAGGHGLAITAVQPFYDEQGLLRGVFGCALLLSQLDNFLRTLKVSEHGQVFIVEPSNLLIATSSGDALLSQDSSRHRMSAFSSENRLVAHTAANLRDELAQLNPQSQGLQKNLEIAGERHFIQLAPLNDEHGLLWLLAVVVPEADFMSHINLNTKLTLLLIVLALALALLVGILTGRWLAAPLLQLNEAAKRLARGEWDSLTCTNYTRGDEIGELSRSFCSMAKQLHEAIHTLEERVAARTSDIARKNQELVRLNQDKNEFLGIAAHDLKNPLSAIKGLSEEIEESYDDMSRDEVMDYATRIQKAAHKMFQLITNLLDVNAIESGKINTELKTLDLLRLTQQLLQDYQGRATHKGITLRFEYNETLNYQVVADENLLNQILDNLISNGIKYSLPNTQITLRLLRPDPQFVHCQVIDQGPGLSDEDQKKLFGKFTRLTPKPTGDEHSTGLGLFIVKKLVEALHGQIWCESTLGQGSTFILALPVSIPEIT